MKKTGFKSLLCILLTVAMLLSTASMTVACAVQSVSELIEDTVVYASSGTEEATKLTDYVDMYFGTDEKSSMSIGPTRPSGSVLPAPDTWTWSYSTGYIKGNPIRGFSQTHMSAGAEKYGNFLISPQFGLATRKDQHDYTAVDETPLPAEYKVTLRNGENQDIGVAFAPTEHAVIYKFTYTEAADLASIVLDVEHNICRARYNIDDLTVTVEEKNGQVIIYGSGEFDAGTSFAPYYQYFYAVINKTPTEIGTFRGATATPAEASTATDKIDRMRASASRYPNLETDIEKDTDPYKGVGAYTTFSVAEGETIEMKIGISFSSVEQAKTWLDSEIPAWDYDTVVADTLALWENKLNTIIIDGANVSEEEKSLFYSCLYKSFINPRDRTGDIAKFGDADMVDDHLCVWDTFRTLYPLYSIIDTSFYKKTVNSFVARLDVNGVVRDHYHAGYERMLSQGGDDVDNIIVEAFLKGILTYEEAEEAYRVIKDNADNWRDDRTMSPTMSDKGKSSYLVYGYIPADNAALSQMCCSKTLEHGYNDYLAAQMALGLANATSDETKKASYMADYYKYLERSDAWEDLWNAEIESNGFTGYIWPKTSSGKWISREETTANGMPYASTRMGSWKPYFYEGTCYEYSFFVPHDIESLIEKMGGESTFIARLQAGLYKGWINLGNQPGFLQAFMFNETSEPWHTTDYVEKLIPKFSLSGGTPGCDDSGSLCAWYIFSTTGFFPNAGQNYYYLTSPKYDSTTYNLENGNSFTITANNLSDTNKYIQSVYLNGVRLEEAKITHSDIMSGGELVFNMGSTPVDYTTYVVDNGTGTLECGYTWSVYNDGTLVISGTGNGTLDLDNTPWESFKNDITKVRITKETEITAIGTGVFAGLVNCKTVFLPTTVTTLGATVFEGNSKLGAVAVNGEAATDGTYELTNITSLAGDTFKDCAAGLTLTLKLGKTNNFAPVKWFTASTTVNFVAEDKTEAQEWLENIESGTDTRDAGYKFIIGTKDFIVGGEQKGSGNLYSWTLDTSTGTLTFTDEKTGEWNELTFDSNHTAFSNWVGDYKDQIKHIVIPSTFGKFTIRNVSSSPFAGLTNLQTVKIDVSRWQMQDGISSLFEGCTSLTGLGKSSGFDANVINLNGFKIEGLGDKTPNIMFKNCSSITSVNLTGLKTYSDDLKTQLPIVLPASAFEGCTSLAEINLGETAVIGSNAFNGCTALTEVNIPAAVTNIGAGAFANCKSLTSINLLATTLPDGFMTKESFPDMDGLTIYCDNNEVASYVEAYGYTNTKVQSLQVVSGIGSNNGKYNGYYSWTLDRKTGILTFKKEGASELAFDSPTNTEHSRVLFAEFVKTYGDEIQHIVIPSTFSKLNLNNYTSPFKNLKNLETVKIDVIRWPAPTALFEGCTSLTTLGTSSSFEEGKIKLNGIQFENVSTCPSSLFKGCSSITSIDFTGLKIYTKDGSALTSTGIGTSFLEGCTSLNDVNLTGVSYIAANAFKGCTSLTNVVIPDSVTSIAANAFAYCTALTSVTLEHTTLPEVTATTFPDRAGLIIYCQNGEIADSINALYTDTKAVNVNVSAEAGIEMIGFAIRTESYNGLRGLFSFDKTAITTNEAAGLTLVEYGTIFSTEANKNTYGTELTWNGTKYVTANNRIIKTLIGNSTGTVGKTLSTSTANRIDFAVSIVRYENNYDTNVCMLGYSIWKDASGTDHIKYVEYPNEAYRALSIYDVTLGMYKDGVINASDDADGVIWGVLEACAATLTAGTDYRDGDADLNGNLFGETVKFLNMPVCSVGYGSTTTGGIVGSASLKGLVFTNPGKITLTLLPDGDEYIAVFRGTGGFPGGYDVYSNSLNQLGTTFNGYFDNTQTNRPAAYLYAKDEADVETIVGYTDEKGQKVKLGSDYSTDDDLLTTSAYRKQPSPTLTEDAAAKIKTVILDEGITAISGYFNASSFTTYIYAESVNTITSRGLDSCKALQTMHPAKLKDENGNFIKPTMGLIDLTGFTKFERAALIDAITTYEVALLLPKGADLSTGAMIHKAKAKVVAISTDRNTLKSGFADLRGITKIADRTFFTDKISTVCFDASITALDVKAFSGNRKFTVYWEGDKPENSPIDSFVTAANFTADGTHVLDRQIGTAGTPGTSDTVAGQVTDFDTFFANLTGDLIETN